MTEPTPGVHDEPLEPTEASDASPAGLDAIDSFLEERTAARAKIFENLADEIARALRPVNRADLAETLREDWDLACSVLGPEANAHQRILLLEHIARIRREKALRARDEAIVAAARAFVELSK